jgi:hypothetical protein
MKQLAKDVLADVRRSVVHLLIVALAPILWTGAATSAWWGSLLSLQDSRTSSIRYWLLFASATALIAVAWSLYLRTIRRVRQVEGELAQARTHPHRFQDDCTFDRRLGVYRHKTSPEFFCASCTPNNVESPLKAYPHGWQCQRKGCDKWHDNPDNPTPPIAPITWSRPGRDTLDG